MEPVVAEQLLLFLEDARAAVRGDRGSSGSRHPGHLQRHSRVGPVKDEAVVGL